MLEFLGTAAVLLVIAGIALLCIRSLWRQRKTGGCSGDCASCGGCSGCNSCAQASRKKASKEQSPQA